MLFSHSLLGEQSAITAANKPRSTIPVINAEVRLFHFSKCFLLRFLYLPLSRFELQPIHFLNALDTCNAKGREIKSRIDGQRKGEGPPKGEFSLAWLQAVCGAGLTVLL